MNKKFFIFAGAIIAIIGVASISLGAYSNFTKSPIAHNKLAQNLQNLIVGPLISSNKDASYFLDTKNYDQIPESTITISPANNSSSTAVAILIPQTHKYPGSNASDPLNDSATIAQGQIYDIISNLQKQDGVNLVMAEGDLEGPVSPDKINSLTQKIKFKDDFKTEIQKIKKADQGQVNPEFYTAAENFISSLERDIILTGAPYKLKAESNDIILYGAENQSLLDKSAEIVRNSIYLQDRLATLQGSNNAVAGNAFNINNLQLGSGSALSSSLNANILKLLQQYGLNSNTSNIENEITKNQADTDEGTELNNLIDSASATYQNIKSLYNTTATTTSNAPSRQDNPYNGVYNTNQIQQLIDKNNQDLQNVVVDQRNQEAANNFVELLNNQKTKVGIITFGSDHKDGLIKELNKRGISVVDITPNEVSNRTQ